MASLNPYFFLSHRYSYIFFPPFQPDFHRTTEILVRKDLWKLPTPTIQSRAVANTRSGPSWLCLAGSLEMFWGQNFQSHNFSVWLVPGLACSPSEKVCLTRTHGLPRHKQWPSSLALLSLQLLLKRLCVAGRLLASAISLYQRPNIPWDYCFSCHGLSEPSWRWFQDPFPPK